LKISNKNFLLSIVAYHINSRAVSYEEGEELARENNLTFLETSAKASHNVEEVI